MGWFRKNKIDLLIAQQGVLLMHADRILARLSRIEQGLDEVLREQWKDSVMAQKDLDALRDQVQSNTNATNAAVTLISGLAEQLKAAADDPEEVRALADQLAQNSASLGAAVTANTPTAGGAPAPTATGGIPR